MMGGNTFIFPRARDLLKVEIFSALSFQLQIFSYILGI